MTASLNDVGRGRQKMQNVKFTWAGKVGIAIILSMALVWL